MPMRSEKMCGVRLADGTPDGFPPRGAYWRDSRGAWMAMTPNGYLGDLSGHEVTEHDDGTITVSPSIRVSSHRHGRDVSWHGYLERGWWREC